MGRANTVYANQVFPRWCRMACFRNRCRVDPPRSSTATQFDFRLGGMMVGEVRRWPAPGPDVSDAVSAAPRDAATNWQSCAGPAAAAIVLWRNGRC
jgi:hypothetical protein